MKRDMDLIRFLLLKLESHETKGGNSVLGASDLQIDGYSLEQVQSHLRMLEISPFLQLTGSRFPNRSAFEQLSWEGRDFLDAIRDDNTWRKTKGAAEKAGVWTLSLLADLGKAFAKAKLKEVTGMEI